MNDDMDRFENYCYTNMTREVRTKKSDNGTLNCDAETVCTCIYVFVHV